MLNRYARAAITRLLMPLAALLLRLGVGPDAVTLIGAGGVVVAALVLYPAGQLFWGSVAITVFVLFDLLDGVMARSSGRSTPWGAFLDSTLDRLADAAIFGGLVLHFTGRGTGTDRLSAVFALACLGLGAIVSYARARAEGIGARADVGVAERGERLLVALVATGLVGLGVPRVVLTAALGLLAVASAVTVVQRVVAVRRQVMVEPARAER